MDKLTVRIILEILGRPPEHVEEGLKTLVLKLGAEKGIKIIEQTLHEPVPVKDSKDLFTSFAELELELDNIGNYFGILFAYMPSHIEVIYPENITLRNEDFNDVGNILAQRLHNYDSIAKKMIYENDLLVKKLKELAPHLFKDKEEKKD